MNDDPREVLSLLNSLGFVGITAHQLKAFMKDLKLYRKIKERERQQRKEEIRRKIINKQQSMISEILREQNNQVNSVSSDSSNFYVDDSLVKVRVKCVPEETADHDREFGDKNRAKSKENLYTARTRSEDIAPTVKSSKPPSDYNSVRHSVVKDTKDNNIVPKRLVKTSSEKTNIYNSKPDGDKEQKQSDLRPLEQQRTKSAPDLVHSSNRVESTRTRSASSTRNSTQSGAKSFIRPWRLHPDVHKTAVKKSDPVTLYHKYQEEWKQVSFPGEAKHGNIRWAVREKMLGTDPHPAPLPRKSNSVPALRKK